MKLAIIGLTTGGKKLAASIAGEISSCEILSVQTGIKDLLTDAWGKYDGIICIMATGIVVRSISHLLKDKLQDPGVVVIDEKGDFVISLLSGHKGGANQLARKIAALTGGSAVITTASDVTGHTSLDLWLDNLDGAIANPEQITRLSAKLVNNGKLYLFSPVTINLPEDIIYTEQHEYADIIINWQKKYFGESLHIVPRTLFAGLGCNRGATCKDFENAMEDLCHQYQIDPIAFAGLASIDLKKDEQGLLDFADSINLPIRFYSNSELNTVPDISHSPVVFAATGAHGVAEPAAILAAGSGSDRGQLIIRKHKWKDVTAAVAEKKLQIPDVLRL